jgi:hypothetical protein
MKLVSESKLTKLFLSRGVDFDQAHILSMEAVILLLENESLEVDYVISQLLERELSKVT